MMITFSYSKKFRTLSLIFLAGISVLHELHAQSLKGTIVNYANQQIKLVGFEGFDTYVIDSVTANEKGVFNLSYNKNDDGMGYLLSEDNKSFFIVLSGETIKLTGDAFALPETIEILEGMENRIFEQYATEHPRREQALSAWEYLEKIYSKDSLFSVQDVPKQVIVNEKQRIKVEDSLFLASLDPDTYVSYYLPLRKLVSSVSTIAQYRTEEIPVAIVSFRKMDYTDPRLHKSGLLRDVIESHFWLIENSGRSLDSVYIEMNISIDLIVENLIANEKKLNEITAYLFKLLEKRSLFKSSEYLSSKLLNEKSCTINNDFAARLESYRAIKVGNTAPDFDIEKGSRSLHQLQSDYTLLFFWASWCGHCTQTLPKIKKVTEEFNSEKSGLRSTQLITVAISLDYDSKEWQKYIQDNSLTTWLNTSELKGWNGTVPKQYNVYATPTMFLLDKDKKIIAKPEDIKQLTEVLKKNN